jgi:hypothetical protein
MRTATALYRPTGSAARSCGCGCGCPSCNRNRPPRTASFEDEASDEAFRALRRIAGVAGAASRRAVQRAASPGRARAQRPAPPRQTPQQRAARRAPAPDRPALSQSHVRPVLRRLGWDRFRQYSGGRVTMGQLAEFQRLGGVTLRRVPGRGDTATLTPRGQQLILTPRFRSLAPLFASPNPAPRPRGTPSQADIYRLRDGQGRPLYIGKTTGQPAARLLRHLLTDRAPVGTGLRRAGQAGQLDQITIDHGMITAPDAGRRSHIAEVLLQEQLAPAWNRPSSHGFDEVAG